MVTMSQKSSVLQAAKSVSQALMSDTPHIPVWDKSARPDGTFNRADFVFDHDCNVYTCSDGAELTSTGNIDQGHFVHYRVSKNDCSICTLKPKCTTAVS